jgi:hypothetical protein
MAFLVWMIVDKRPLLMYSIEPRVMLRHFKATNPRWVPRTTGHGITASRYHGITASHNMKVQIALHHFWRYTLNQLIKDHFFLNALSNQMHVRYVLRGF